MTDLCFSTDSIVALQEATEASGWFVQRYQLMYNPCEKDYNSAQRSAIF